ncbi:class I SAM-dependent methyltransferase [Legionella sp. CNM-4043-24]|uniref:class I SAM-dependent methyltransferase n=1 Tax=Legionella sp. CNM-4043-24 TaxID=3421646 RepID=UPI00403AEC23
MQCGNGVNTASAYFNENWQRYQSSVKNNTLYHREMLSALKQFLSANAGERSFSFVDVGCGDSSTVAPVLAGRAITKYIGIDAAENVLQMASQSLAHLECEKEFIADNMTTAVPRLSSPVDIIFTSYAVHHLSLQDKFNFIESCRQKLNPNGFLLMVDGVLKEKQTRAEWLNALQERMGATIPGISPDELAFRMQHPRADDFPESIETFSNIAQQQAWTRFELIVDKGLFAFMVFSK